MDTNRRPGDWDCPSCEHMNFASRSTCRSCSNSRDGQQSNSGSNHSEARPGDWDCSSCQHLNFAKRDTCRNCGAQKDAFGAQQRLPDWTCSGCSFNNFGRNKQCLKCNTVAPTFTSNNNNFAKAGDWHCSCGELVFASRNACRSCGNTKPGNSYNKSFNQNSNYNGSYGGFGGKSSQMKPGDWMCTCGEHVFGTKDSCRKCGAAKPQPSITYSANNPVQTPQRGVILSARPGDWSCSCGFMNFASRSECYTCKKEKST